MMHQQISPFQLGNRIKQRRKAKGLSQEDLAKLVALSRSAIAKIESGQRSITALELVRFSEVLMVSVDEILSQHYKVNATVDEEEQTEVARDNPRVSLPELQLKKFKNVLLYILEHCAGKPNVGETVLYKLLYFSDFNYYEIYEEHLTGARYRKLPYGPVPYKLDGILQQMIKAGELQRIKTEYHGLPQSRYLPLKKADLVQLNAAEKEVIDHVIACFSDWSASAISDYSHRDMPWRASEDGAFIDYELVFYRDAPFSRNFLKNVQI